MTTQQSRTHEQSVGERLHEKVSDAAQSMQDIGGAAKELAQEKLEKAGNQLGQYYEQGQAKAQEMEQSLENLIRERPIKSIMIAAGIGLVLGGLALRR